MENKELQYAEDFVLSTHRNVFLTGKAGTGKTTFLKSVLKKTHKNSVIVAPTGVAAINAGGVTIHSMFQLPTTAFIPTPDYVNPSLVTNTTELAKTQKLRTDKRKVMQELELLVIDEISMVRADLLDAIDMTLRRVRRSPNPFGGVQVVAIGDLFQLSPVVKEDTWNILGHFYKSPFFFSAHAWQKSNPIAIELKNVYRQSDQTFVDLLNRVRNGVKSDKDLEVLNQQYVENIEDDVITLTTHNRKADRINQDQLAKLKTAPITLQAKISGRFYESSYPVPEKFQLKIGAQIMFIRNHPEGLYFNGRIGKLVDKVDEFLKVEFNDGSNSIIVEREEWKNTTFKVDEKTKEILQEDIGSFLQYPVRLAWAVTVHKSQGLTFDKLQLDLENSFAAGQLYVALSRCRSLEGLKLLSKIRPDNIIVDKRILDYHHSINEEYNFEEDLKVAKEKYQKHLLKASFNFHKYLDYIKSWQSFVVEKQDDYAMEILTFIKGIKTVFQNTVKTGEKFQWQLESLFEENSKAIIKDRVDKAIRYFSDEINAKVLLPIESHIEEYRVKKGTRKYLNQTRTFGDECWHLMEKIYNISYKGEKVFTGIKKYKPDNSSAIKKKYEKGDTYKQTLELFEQGKTIEEIACLRFLSKGTIESHMLKHLKNGAVDINKLMPNARYQKIRKFALKNPNKSVSELVHDIDISIDYIEARWVKATLQLEKESD